MCLLLKTLAVLINSNQALIASLADSSLMLWQHPSCIRVIETHAHKQHNQWRISGLFSAVSRGVQTCHPSLSRQPRLARS